IMYSVCGVLNFYLFFLVTRNFKIEDMEFDFTSLAFGGEQHIVAWDAKRIGALKPEDQQNLAKVLDVFGKKSAVAQGLQTPVTDIHRLRTTDQRLYLYMYRQSNKTVVLGGLKIGTKRLYVRTVTADLREIEPICVLDFYVHESCQRRGVGKALFEHFLNTEGCDPASLAYDRPSPKLLAFLRKHYCLQEYVPQSNNYVVFNRYFDINPTSASTSRSQGRLNSRGSITSTGTPHVHPLHGSRSTPPPLPPSPLLSQPPPLPVPTGSAVPGWPGVATVSTPSTSTVAQPQPLGGSPSFGRRWAANNFGSGPVQESAADATVAYSNSLGDALDAFSRAHANGSSCPQQGSYQAGSGGRQPAPWEGTPAASQPPPASSRSGYSSRPPWAVDDTPPSGSGLADHGAVAVSPMVYGVGATGAVRTPQAMERLGTGSSNVTRGPLQTILNGGGGRDSGGSGPHTRALQQQVAALQLSDGAAAMQTPHLAAQQQPSWGPIGTPAGNSRLSSSAEDSAAAGRSAARIMAVAQRSGAGAADCLVW
ncbi:hypothetical protein Vretifemale_11855, partial [Volvox reticuliferus]